MNSLVKIFARSCIAQRPKAVTCGIELEPHLLGISDADAGAGPDGPAFLGSECSVPINFSVSRCL
jgi:hypothetical protein